MNPTAESDIVTLLAAFARALRTAGVAADQGRVAACLTALALIDPADTGAVYWAARVTLCSEPDDFARFDQVFATWFLNRAAVPARPQPPPGQPPY